MAGLSMGGAQTFSTALDNLDGFAYLGGLSGSCAGRGGTFDPKTACGGALADQLPARLRPATVSVESPGTDEQPISPGEGNFR